MTKYLMILMALFALIACGGDDDNDPVDNEPVNDNAQPDADTAPVWITEQTYAGLEWSPRSYMKWQAAIDYCEAMGARLPNINELRKIIINCPGSTYGGACQVSDPDCLSYKDCRKEEDCRCDGSAESYSALGDGKGIRLWSSSSRADDANRVWGVGFASGNVSSTDKGSSYHARCVR